MMLEKQGNSKPVLRRWLRVDDIVWSMQKCIAAKAGKVLRTLSNITDEQNHLRVFFNMYLAHKAERPEVFTPELKEKAREILRTTAEMEIKWGKSLIEGGIMGLSEQVVEGYVKYLTDYFAEGLGLGLIFGTDAPTPNPCEWVEERMQEFGIDTNFFEDKEDSYDNGSEW